MVVICVARRYIHLYTDDSLLFKKQSENSLVCYKFHEKKEWLNYLYRIENLKEREREEGKRERERVQLVFQDNCMCFQMHLQKIRLSLWWKKLLKLTAAHFYKLKMSLFV